MEGCLDGCAGCFLWIAFFIVVIIIAYIIFGIFWIALIAGTVFLIFWILGRITVSLFRYDRRKKRR